MDYYDEPSQDLLKMRISLFPIIFIDFIDVF